MGGTLERLSTIEDIKVELIGAISNPYETAVASARTCYSSKGIIHPEDVSKTERAVELRDKIAASTLLAGHLTTRQHAHFVFAISGVSRQLIWSFLHSHPYYNSEQVSQRYVRVQRGNFFIPNGLSEKATRLYVETVDAQLQSYERLIEVLRKTIAVDFFDRFKARSQQPEKWSSSIDKRTYEVARYVLGIGTTAYLYHTVSSLTLLRYAKICQHFDVPSEQQRLIQLMLDRVREVDPLFEKELQDPLPLDKTVEYQIFSEFKNSFKNKNHGFADSFDRRLEGRTSKLISATPNAESLLAETARVALGLSGGEVSDSDLLERLLDPKFNPLLADTLNVSSHDRLSQILHHVHFTFQKKLSHTADSQDQRHRTVFASRPMLSFHYSAEPDYITPFGVTQSEDATILYRASMQQSFEAVNTLLDMGVPEEKAFYLLPNALTLRMVSTGDLHSYIHKWKLRSCYNAQEEIFRATLDEMQQVTQLYPKIGNHLRAPCYFRLRAGVKPFCPEGDRFCGLPVWKYSLDEYQRKSL